MSRERRSTSKSAARARADDARGLVRNEAQLGLRFGERDLDFEPRLERAEVAPDAAGLGVIPVAGDEGGKQADVHDGEEGAVSRRSTTMPPSVSPSGMSSA